MVAVRLLYALAGSAALHGFLLLGLAHYADVQRAGWGAATGSEPINVGFRALDGGALSQDGRKEPPPIRAEWAGPEPAEPSAAPPIPLPYYYPLRELDRRPVALEPVAPIMGEARAGDPQEGFVVLRLLLSETGGIDRVLLVRSEPPGVFDTSALAAFSGAKFSPGIRQGVPVRSEMVIRVQYSQMPSGDSRTGP